MNSIQKRLLRMKVLLEKVYKVNIFRNVEIGKIFKIPKYCKEELNFELGSKIASTPPRCNYAITLICRTLSAKLCNNNDTL